MSNQLRSLDDAELARIHGGDNRTANVELRGPAGTGVTIHAQSTRSNYERCLDAAQRTARERHPDPRNLLEVLVGRPDPNAARRADYERDNVRACGTPPQG